MLRAGLVTGIGSLPHVDGHAATAFALAATPDLPAAPTLPRRSAREGMLAEALDTDVDRFVGLRALLDARGTGPVKVQLTGPVTLGLALHRAGRPADVAFATAAARVSTRANALRSVIAGGQVVCFLDEPAFAGVAPDTAVPLVAAALSTLASFAVTGVHCCGPADWAAIVSAGPDVLSLPVELAGSLPASVLGSFLDGGGWVAWGAVPTDRSVEAGAIEALWHALAGCGGLERSLVTPACGLAGRTIDEAATVYALARELGDRIATT